MVWLENLQVKSSEGESFSSLDCAARPVLNRGIASSSGPRKANLAAHVGWATFLKWRDGQQRLDPDQQYAQALEIDPANPYANAYRAHWLLQTKARSGHARGARALRAALTSGRAKEHVRTIQLAALGNLRHRQGTPSSWPSSTRCE